MVTLDTLNIIAKLCLYIGAVAAAGSPLLSITVSRVFRSGQPSGVTFNRFLRVQGLAGAAITILAALGLYIIFQIKIAGGDVALGLSSDFIIIGMETAVGHSMIASLAGAGIAFGGWVLSNRWVSVVGAVGVLSAFALQGHTISIAVDSGLPIWNTLPLSIALVLHLAIATWWFAVLLPLQFSAVDDRNAAAHCFGEYAVRAVPLLLLLGASLFIVLNGWRLDFTDPYQRRMALKVLAVTSVLGLAALNKLWLTGKPGLVWSLRIETLAALGVLVATAWLTATGPASME